jgi:hypothetical protein
MESGLSRNANSRTSDEVLGSEHVASLLSMNSPVIVKVTVIANAVKQSMTPKAWTAALRSQ